MAARNLTVGAVPRLVAALALPVFGSFILQSLYALADLYFVGRLGGAAVAGLAISLNTFFVTLSLGMVLGVGALAILAQVYGRGDSARIPHLFQQVLLMALLIGGCAWAAGLALTRPFFSLFTADPTVQALGAEYFRIYAATFLLQLLLMACGFCFRAVGDFITPTLLMGLGVVLNFVLDPLLIFGLGPLPALGMRGAALATVLAQATGVGVYAWLVLVARRNAVLAVRRPLRPDWPAMWRMLRIGLPAGAQMLLFALLLMGVYRVVRPFGADASAAVGVGFRVMQAVTLPVVAIGAAVAALAGQNLGARQPARVKAALAWGMVYTATLMGLGYGALAGWAPLWISAFSAKPAIVAIGTDFLRIAGMGLPLHGAGYMVTAMAQGMGRTLYPLLGQTARVLGFLAGLALLEHTLGLGLEGIFWSYALAFAVEFAVMGGALLLLLRLLAQAAPGKGRRAA